MQFSMAATDVIGKTLQDIDRARKPDYQVFLEDNWMFIAVGLAFLVAVLVARMLKK